jgi:hypothetical protein
MISAIEVSYYPLGAQVMTLVLPLGLFILVMIVLYFVFSRPHTVPGHRPVTGARPVAPSGEAAAPIAAATGFPTATSAGGTEPLADRGTPPVIGAHADKAAEADDADTAAADPGGPDAGGTTGPDDAASTAKPEDPE